MTCSALVGLGSFATVNGGLFSIVGGNGRILRSALDQANQNRKAKCGSTKAVRHVRERVSSVIGGLDSELELYDEAGKLVGEFDVVILAAPLQQARISFLIQSHMDGAVLQPMPLNGMIDTDSEDHDVPNEGHVALPEPLPSSATRPYASVVTTVVSRVNMEALAQHFSLSVTNLPRSIMVTEQGKAYETNVTAITQVSSSGVYKVFSSDQLQEANLRSMFGENVLVEHVQIWGGPHGGATPDYRGEGSSMNYLLYDGGQGLDGHRSAALYYANAIESSFACMELSAIGAKSVAKLAARKLELVLPVKTELNSDEL